MARRWGKIFHLPSLIFLDKTPHDLHLVLLSECSESRNPWFAFPRTPKAACMGHSYRRQSIWQSALDWLRFQAFTVPYWMDAEQGNW